MSLSAAPPTATQGGVPERAAGRPRARWLGLGATLVTVALLESLALLGYRVPNPPAFILLAVVFAAYSGGLRVGLPSALVGWLYFAWSFSLPGTPFRYDAPDLARVIIWAFATPTMAILVGLLRRDAERARADAVRAAAAGAVAEARVGSYEELRASEHRYRTLAATMVEGILILQDGRFAYANPGALDLLGYSFEELQGREFAPFIHPEDRELVRERHRRRTAGEVLAPRYDIRVLPRAGEPRWVQIANERVDWEGRPAVLTVIGDITERKAAEQALRASEERFAKLFREAPDPMTLVRAADASYLDVNREFEKQTGFSRQEAVGRTSQDLGVWHVPRERDLMLRSLQETGAVDGVEFLLRRRDGVLRSMLLGCVTVEIAGEACWLFTLRDVTERKRAEAALRDSEQRFRALVDLSSDWYWVTDTEHRFTFREGEILQRMGIPPEADYGKRRWEMGFLNLSEADWAVHRALLERREEFRELLLERRSADGRVHWATISGRPLYDPSGRFLGYHGTGRDVTRQVQAEERLRRFNEELERKVVERTAELDAANRELEAFTYSVSHDLRAPLRAIDGFSRMLEERHAGALPAEAREQLQRVRAAARRMGQLIEDLIAFSRIGRGALHRRAVDLSALARLVAKELEALAPERRVEWRLAEGLAAHADPGLARVVLENLLGNAWKYSAKAPRPVIEFARTVQGEFVVRDNGAGFDPARAEGLFQPFRRLHAAEDFEGTGIGLATVKRVVERHGGHVRGEGAVGAGAAFYFTLPEAEPAPGPGAQQ